MFAYLGFKEQNRRNIYLAAIFLGLSVNVRLQSLFFAPLLLVMTLMPARGMRPRWLLHCAAVCVVFVAAAAPILVFNTVQFRSPLKTGYDFWAPYFSMKHLLFLPGYIPRNAVNLWRQFCLQTHAYDPAYIFGTGTCVVPAFMLLVFAGSFFVRWSWFVGCAGLAGFSSLTAALCYLFGRDGRLYLSLFILVVAIAVLPVTWAANNILAGRRIVTSTAILILFAAACLGYPSRSGYNTSGINRSQAWDALHFASLPSTSMEFLAQRQLAQQLNSKSGIVLSDIDPVYLNALLPSSVVAAPVDGRHHYKWSYIWRYDRPQALALVEYGLKQSVPVYALFISYDQAAKEESRLPTIAGHEWHAPNNSSGVAILQLTPAERSAAESAPE
jgi:hypothetical protein